MTIPFNCSFSHITESFFAFCCLPYIILAFITIKEFYSIDSKMNVNMIIVFIRFVYVINALAMVSFIKSFAMSLNNSSKSGINGLGRMVDFFCTLLGKNFIAYSVCNTTPSANPNMNLYPQLSFLVILNMSSKNNFCTEPQYDCYVLTYQLNLFRFAFALVDHNS